MYGAGHGGIEAVLLAGITMVNNLVVALAMNRGGLEAVEQLTGPVSESGQAALAALTTAPAGIYLWSGFERLTALVLHIALSVLVYRAVHRRRPGWGVVAVLLHGLADLPPALYQCGLISLAGSEAGFCLAAAAAALLPWKTGRQEEA